MAEELPAWRQDLEELGWTRIELCRRLGLSKDAPKRWKEKAPPYVMEYLRVCKAIKEGYEP